MVSHDTTCGPCPRALSRPRPNHHITTDFRHSSGAVKSNQFKKRDPYSLQICLLSFGAGATSP